MTILAKIVLIGDGAVGKTSLRQRYLGKGFKKNYLPTLGADFVSKTIKIDDKDLSFQIWDLAGQPTFKQIRKLYYQNAVGAILVFDITSYDSLVNLKKWLRELINNSKSNKIALIVLGNKCDLPNDSWISENTVHKIIQELEEVDTVNNEIKYFRTSAKDNTNINPAFLALGRDILALMQKKLEINKVTK